MFSLGALVKTDEQEVINFLLTTEIIPLCLRIMESGSELSKTVLRALSEVHHCLFVCLFVCLGLLILYIYEYNRAVFRHMRREHQIPCT
jgi:hypothetical protein